MNKNLHLIERGLRLMAGIFLLGWSVAGGPWWGYSGIIFIATAAWGFCPLYWSLRRQ